MRFNRQVISYLEKWKSDPLRKPLIIRGARQVGKTTLIKNFGERYDHFILINLEKESSRKYFESHEDVKSIIEVLFLENNLDSSKIGKTLLFLDEIQESPKAIHLLRYFFEELPELSVIAAGSLLEFSLRHIPSFPVGRVDFLYLHPMNFPEYLEAIGQKVALKQLLDVPINPLAHTILMKHFHRYAIVGGMPEVIQKEIEKKNLSDLPAVYESIWGTYKADIEKYTSNDTDRKIIRHIFNSAPLYLDERIKFQGFGNSNYRSREVGKCFRILEDARVLRMIFPSTDMIPPIRPDLKKSPRIQLLDTGLVSHSLGIQSQLLAMEDLSQAFKGALIPHLLTQELISINNLTDQKPNFWVREKNQSTAEVDLIVSFKGMVIPIEIKSGSTGTLKSLHQFVDACDHGFAIRIYGGSLKLEESKTPNGKNYRLLNLPYYLGTKIQEYLEWFIS